MLYSIATEPKNTEKHPATGNKQGQIGGKPCPCRQTRIHLDLRQKSDRGAVIKRLVIRQKTTSYDFYNMPELDLSNENIETWPQAAAMADLGAATSLNLRYNQLDGAAP